MPIAGTDIHRMYACHLPPCQIRNFVYNEGCKTPGSRRLPASVVLIRDNAKSHVEQSPDDSRACPSVNVDGAIATARSNTAVVAYSTCTCSFVRRSEAPVRETRGPVYLPSSTSCSHDMLQATPGPCFVSPWKVQSSNAASSGGPRMRIGYGELQMPRLCLSADWDFLLQSLISRYCCVGIYLPCWHVLTDSYPRLRSTLEFPSHCSRYYAEDGVHSFHNVITDII